MEASERSTADRQVHGIVLAAGRSRRMKRAKALLEASGTSFIEHAVAVLRAGGCTGVVAVVGSDDLEAARLARAAGGRIAVSAGDRAEQIDSLRIGLAAVPAAVEGVLVLPVDQPLVRASTVAAVLDAFRASSVPVVRPTYRGRPGHPTLFARSVFAELTADPLPEGARAVVQAHAAELEDVPVDDPGVVADINTPDDYSRYVQST